MIKIKFKKEITEKIKDEDEIHLPMLLTHPMLTEILKTRPDLKTISIAPQTRITPPAKELLNKKKIRTKTKVLKGRQPRRDKETIKAILREIKMGTKYKKISEKYDVPKSMITYYKRSLKS